jgi:hypothetical protein
LFIVTNPGGVKIMQKLQLRSCGVFCAGLAVLVMAGCAANADRKPTHYWDAKVKPTAVYQEDNAACESANGAQSSNPMLAKSGEFQAYKDCMVSRGYVLRTY